MLPGDGTTPPKDRINKCFPWLNTTHPAGIAVGCSCGWACAQAFTVDAQGEQLAREVAAAHRDGDHAMLQTSMSKLVAEPVYSYELLEE